MDFVAGAVVEGIKRYGLVGIGLILAFGSFEPTLGMFPDLVGSQFTVVDGEAADVAGPRIEELRGDANNELAAQVLGRKLEARKWIWLPIDVDYGAVGPGSDDDDTNAAVVEHAADFDESTFFGAGAKVVFGDDQVVGPLANDELLRVGAAIEGKDGAQSMERRSFENGFECEWSLICAGRVLGGTGGCRRNRPRGQENSVFGEADAVGIGKPGDMIGRSDIEGIEGGEEDADDHGDAGEFQTAGLPEGWSSGCH